MNPCNNLHSISVKFQTRLNKLKSEAKLDPKKNERYSVLSIALLNNFLRAYLLSINIGAVNSKGFKVSFANVYSNESLLIDDIMQYGFLSKWNKNKGGPWTPKDEPAYHNPKIFLQIATNLKPTNLSDISNASTCSWKIDVLREIRNYYAHRSQSTEEKALHILSKYYGIQKVRAADALNQYDASILATILEDINDYLISFATDIS